MSSVSVQDLYPLTNNGAILEAFFKDMKGNANNNGKKGFGTRGAGGRTITSKIWSEIEMLNNSDPIAFFTVVFHHPSLHVVLPECLEVAARSIVSTSKMDRVPKTAIHALSEIVIKIITGFDINNANGLNANNSNKRLSVDMISYCVRLQKLFPASCWMSMAHVLYRQNPAVTTIVMNALLLHLPADLPSLKAISMTWCDQVGILVDKCVIEAKRGRFMRTNGDILVLFETAFRLSHEMWCLLEAAPIPITPFLALDHVLDSLADLTNKISPLLQYFVLHSDDLQSSRKRLSRANALIVNAAVRASVILTLFTPFVRGTAEESTLSLAKGTGYANPRPVASLDESLTAQLLQYLPASSLPCVLMKRCGSYTKALKNVIPLLSNENSGGDGGNAKSPTGRGANRRSAGQGASISKRRITADHNVTIFDAGAYRLGEVLSDLIRDCSDNNNSKGGNGGEADGETNAKKSIGASTRFIELLLIELVSQGCSIRDWAERDLIDAYEQTFLGGGSSSSSSGSNNAPPQQQQQRKKGQQPQGSSFDEEGGGGYGGDEEAQLRAALLASQNGGGAKTSGDDDDAALAAAIAASRAEAGLDPEDNPASSSTTAAAASSSSAHVNNSVAVSPAAEIVLSVLPHFTPQQAEAALAYYNNNVESLIMDATSDNLPPHLLQQPKKEEGVSSSSSTTKAAAASSGVRFADPNSTTSMAASAAGNANSKKTDDDDDDDEMFPPHLDMFSFLNEIDNDHGNNNNSHATKKNAYTLSSASMAKISGGNAADDDDDDGNDVNFDFTEGGGMGDVIYSSDMYFGGMGALGTMSDDLKHRTLMLAQAQNERLYDDERDDAVDEDDEANRFLAGKIKAANDEDSDDDEETATKPHEQYHYQGDNDTDAIFQPAFNNHNFAGPRGNASSNTAYKPRYTEKSTTFRVGGDSRNARAGKPEGAGGGKDPRDKKKEKPKRGDAAAPAAAGHGHGGGGKGGRGGGGDSKGPKGGKVNKSNVAKLMKAGVLN